MKPPRRPAPEPAPPAPAVRDEDLDFAALMQHEGVKPVAPTSAVTARKASKPAAHQAAIASKVSSQRPVVSKAAGQTTATVSRVTSHATASKVASHSPGPASKVAASKVASHSTAAASKGPPPAPQQAPGDELVARIAVITRERDAALLANATLQAELTARNHDILMERDAVTTLRAQLRTIEAAHRAELGRVAAQEPVRVGLAAALLARGIVSMSEQAQALGLLMAGESAARLLELLETRDPDALVSVLERRLALVCGDSGCAPEVGAAALQVEPARCEVCGGSDIQRAAHGFERACAAANIVRVRFVGGSPNYRTKLAALFPAGGPLNVHTTLGDKRVRLNRSRSQQRGDDLVIIWGATELDHATSGAYRAEYGRTEVIAHRGIGRMLELAAARIGGAPPGHSR